MIERKSKTFIREEMQRNINIQFDRLEWRIKIGICFIFSRWSSFNHKNCSVLL